MTSHHNDEENYSNKENTSINREARYQHKHHLSLRVGFRAVIRSHLFALIQYSDFIMSFFDSEFTYVLRWLRSLPPIEYFAQPGSFFRPAAADEDREDNDDFEDAAEVGFLNHRMI